MRAKCYLRSPDGQILQKLEIFVRERPKFTVFKIHILTAPKARLSQFLIRACCGCCAIIIRVCMVCFLHKHTRVQYQFLRDPKLVLRVELQKLEKLLDFLMD